MSLPQEKTELSLAHRAAARLEEDIRLRGLNEGARYLNTDEAGQMLGVSRATAQRAMTLMADRRWLVRRRRSGTFVGPRATPSPATSIRTIYQLTPPPQRNLTLLEAEPLVRGIQRGAGDVNVQFCFMPAENGLDFVKELIRGQSAGGHMFGIIARSCGEDIYRFLADSGVPTVVSGNLPLGAPRLPSVHLDHYRAGQLIIEHLIERGHRRIAHLATTLDRPGDLRLHEGMSEALTKARLPHNSLMLQVVSQSMDSIVAAVEYILEGPDAPTALIARSERLADMIGRALIDPDLSTGQDREIVFVDHKTERVQQSPYAHVRTAMHREVSYTLIGEMFQKISRGEDLDEEEVVLSVELHQGKEEDSPV